jgi:hypothetical protein
MAGIDNTVAMMVLMNTPLDTFLKTIHVRASDGMSVDQMTDEVLKLAGAGRDAFEKEAIEVFTKYLEYFIEVAGAVYGTVPLSK